MTKILLMAIAIAFILEGLGPALFPNKWRAYVAKLGQESATNIRAIGLFIIIAGALLLWLVSSL